MKKIKITLLLLLSSLILSPSTFPQGPLAPPTGAPAPTMKTLDQIEPRKDIATLPGGGGFNYVITQSGSYYLTANLAIDKTNGLRVAARGVTIDLNGFQIRRTAVGGGIAIAIDSNADEVTIKNGSINAFTSAEFATGIQNSSSNGTFIGLKIDGCTAGALNAGAGATIIDCIANKNSSFGIRAGKASVLTRCIARGNIGNSAIEAGTGSTLTDCVAETNQGTSVYLVDQGSSLRNCTAYGNKCTQIFFTSTSVALADCVAQANITDYGFRIGAGSTLTNCTARGNTSAAAASFGINAGDGSTLTSCTSSGNGNSNASPSATSGLGIFGGSGSTIKDCTAASNKGAGIQIAIGSTVTGCTVRSNGSDGILAPNDCLIARNSCSQNGTAITAAGIHVTSQGNRIEENHVVFNNDTGIKVDNANNLVVKNSSRFNSSNTKNYVIVAGNFVGTIVTTAAALNSASNSNVNISF
jgi:parallel beta-helix repeat protein